MTTVGSVCSGIEAASVAWEPLGWKAAWLAEIEPFPSAVLAHHYPEVPNLGDMATIAKRVLLGEVEAPDVLTGGTPCQAFSVAGLRKSLDDARGNLTLKFVELLDAIDHVRGMRGRDPATAIWENVPGVLSTKDNAFGCFLAGLAGEDDALQPPGGKWANAGCVYGPQRAVAWRTLDAQYFGLAQRRRRVFVVASARGGFDPAQVLFEWEGVRRDSAPRRKAGQEAAATLDARTDGGGFPGTDGACGGHVVPAVCPTLRAGGNRTGGDRPPGTDVDTADSLIPVTAACLLQTTGRSYDTDTDTDTILPVAFQAGNLARGAGSLPNAEVFPTLKADHGRGLSDQHPCGAFPANLSGTQCATTENLAPSMGAANPTAVAVALRGREGGGTAELGDEVQNFLRASQGGGDKPHVLSAMQVRRLTPRECERLQGFPDDYTLIPWRKKPAEECPDGPRYKALGNSWAVPVARWVGWRVAQHLEALDRKAA